jgi:hypothetical protein
MQSRSRGLPNEVCGIIARRAAGEHHLVIAFAGLNRHAGSTETTDFVFEEQTGIEDRVLKMYGRLKAASPRRQLGRVVYRSDRQMIPLQAADLIAWQMHRFRCSSEPISIG